MRGLWVATHDTNYGIYKVYATIGDYGKFGKRIKKVEIEMLPDL